MKVGGIVLCGGQSTRMGRPKAWLPFAGELMLQRVLRLLGTVVQPIVVVAAPEQDVVKVKLKKGKNKVLLKIDNGDGSHGFYFSIESGEELK